MGMRARVNEAGRSSPNRKWTRSELVPEVSGTTVFNSGQFTTTQHTRKCWVRRTECLGLGSQGVLLKIRKQDYFGYRIFQCYFQIIFSALFFFFVNLQKTFQAKCLQLKVWEEHLKKKKKNQIHSFSLFPQLVGATVRGVSKWICCVKLTKLVIWSCRQYLIINSVLS